MLLALLLAATLPVPDPGLTAAREDRFASLADAVAAGVVDRALLAELTADGRTDATVTLGDEPSVAAAERARAGGRVADEVAAAIRAAVVGLRQPVEEALRSNGGGAVLRSFDHVPILAARFDSGEALLRVANRPEVVAIHPEIAVTPHTLESGPLVRQPEAAALGQIGAGTTVAVLDSGVDYRRAAFGACLSPGSPATCRVTASVDIAPGDGQLDDGTLHGTNVSGIVAGVAAGAKLVVLDVIGSNGTASSTDLIAGIDWAIRRAGTYNIRALNISLGSGSYSSSCPPDPGLRTAVAAGIVPAVSAGNSGSTGGVAWPACVTDAIAVGAVYDADVGSRRYSVCTDSATAADRIACFSQSGTNLDLLAPGAIITAAEISMAGTSQASPHVAAAAAIVAGADPEATAAEVRAALVQSGPLLTDARNGLVRRRLDIFAAVEARIGPADVAPSPVPAPTPTPTPTPAPPPPPGDDGHPFTDIGDSPFEGDIIWIYQRRITAGCATDRYCPGASILRDQMASFLARAFELPPTSLDFFTDDEGNQHEGAINRVAAAGITLGCAPQRYCPTRAVTREQMASFLTRASNFAGRPLPPAMEDFFTDDDDSDHEGDINRVAAARITRGCSATTYCPTTVVTRGQMAAFLRRALE